MSEHRGNTSGRPALPRILRAVAARARRRYRYPACRCRPPPRLRVPRPRPRGPRRSDPLVATRPVAGAAVALGRSRVAKAEGLEEAPSPPTAPIAAAEPCPPQPPYGARPHTCRSPLTLRSRCERSRLRFRPPRHRQPRAPVGSAAGRPAPAAQLATGRPAAEANVPSLCRPRHPRRHPCSGWGVSQRQDVQGTETSSSPGLHGSCLASRTQGRLAVGAPAANRRAERCANTPQGRAPPTWSTPGRPDRNCAHHSGEGARTGRPEQPQRATLGAGPVAGMRGARVRQRPTGGADCCQSAETARVPHRSGYAQRSPAIRWRTAMQRTPPPTGDGRGPPAGAAAPIRAPHPVVVRWRRVPA